MFSSSASLFDFAILMSKTEDLMAPELRAFPLDAESDGRGPAGPVVSAYANPASRNASSIDRLIIVRPDQRNIRRSRGV